MLSAFKPVPNSLRGADRWVGFGMSDIEKFFETSYLERRLLRYYSRSVQKTPERRTAPACSLSIYLYRSDKPARSGMNTTTSTPPYRTPSMEGKEVTPKITCPNTQCLPFSWCHPAR